MQTCLTFLSGPSWLREHFTNRLAVFHCRHSQSCLRSGLLLLSRLPEEQHLSAAPSPKPIVDPLGLCRGRSECSQVSYPGLTSLIYLLQEGDPGSIVQLLQPKAWTSKLRWGAQLLGGIFLHDEIIQRRLQDSFPPVPAGSPVSSSLEWRRP